MLKWVGVVIVVIIMFDVKDEIDWEWFGFNIDMV